MADFLGIVKIVSIYILNKRWAVIIVQEGVQGGNIAGPQIGLRLACIRYILVRSRPFRVKRALGQCFSATAI